MRKVRRKTFSRAAHFHAIFKNSPSSLRRTYWILTTLLDLVGFFILFYLLAHLYSYLSLYLTNIWLCHLSLIIFFCLLGVLGFFFHIKVTLSLLTFFYKWYYERRRKG